MVEYAGEEFGGGGEGGVEDDGDAVVGREGTAERLEAERRLERGADELTRSGGGDGRDGSGADRDEFSWCDVDRPGAAADGEVHAGIVAPHAPLNAANYRETGARISNTSTAGRSPV